MNSLYAICIFMVMKFIQSKICNESNYHNLSYLQQSLILCQSFTKEEVKENKGRNVFVQKKVLVVPNQYQIFLSVKIDIDHKEWSGLSPYERRRVWLKSKSQLYWSCGNSDNSLSLCNSSGMLSTTSLTIDIYDVLSSLHYLQCSICFLTEPNTEYFSHLSSLSPNIERIVFNLHQYLPQYLSNDHSAVQFQITRFDRIPVGNEIGKIFITNISLSDILNKHGDPISNNNCQFFCGWGPKCLLQLRDVCNKKFNCVLGEDEDYRLCKAIENGIISIKYDFQTTSSNFNKNQNDSVWVTIRIYLYVIICTVILLALFLFVCWFMCRNCEIDNRYGGSSRKLNSTMVTPDSDTTCSTCEMKYKLNPLEVSRRSRRPLSSQQSLFPGRADTANLQILKFNRKERHLNAISSSSHSSTDKESLRQLCHNSSYYSNRDRTIQSSEWLNLFFHVSTEARHKSLVNQPPPNVDNSSSDIAINDKNHKFSTTPLTYVFLVMI